MAVVMQHDVCDTSRIYCNEFRYSLPESMLKGFISGVAFDHKEPYTADDAASLQEDIRDIYRRTIESPLVVERMAVLTAGAPGAGKTYLMRADLAARGAGYAYVDPDDTCLVNMTRTYGTTPPGRAQYDKWRPGSNAACHLILSNLIRDNRAFYFGTTATSPQTGLFLRFLKEHGYTIRIMHLTAPDEVRWASVRNHAFLHTTETDVAEKGRLLPQRLPDYFEHADEIEFYLREDAGGSAIQAAVWTRGWGTTVLSPPAFTRIKEIHNAAIAVLGRSDLAWAP